MLRATTGYCGNDLPPNVAATEDDCKKPCEGNPLEYCGGGLRLSVYGFTDAPAPATNADIGNFVYQGCHGSLPSAPLLERLGTRDLSCALTGTL